MTVIKKREAAVVARLIDLDPDGVLLLCRLLHADVQRLDLTLDEVEMMLELQDRYLVDETADLKSFTLTGAGRELAVKVSLVFGERNV